MASSGNDDVTLNRLATVARLVAGATHEVNNALQVIGGTVELLSSAADVPADVRAALARIGAQSARAAAAMAGVTELARPHGPAGHVIVDLRHVASKASALRRYAIGRAGLTIGVEVGEDALLVRGDAAQLLQAVLNLLDNAEQAMAKAGTGHLIVSTDAHGAHALLAVSDEGPGLSADIVDRAFDRYVTTSPRPDSLGLGLTAARAIADAHGGTLVAEPCARGARFVMRLPRQTA